MSHPNPKSRQEFDFIVGLIRNCRKEEIAPEKFLELLDKLWELYGIPMISQLPQDLSSRIRDSSPLVGIFNENGWEQMEEQDDVVIGPKYYFGDVRRIVLEEFYPGRGGFDRIRRYWKENRVYK
ncbi:MAG TPA: hypothetical protein VJJ52_06865 [Candidatus Nanoarchaeia archaeon]|nr:hypothetical protein [Candidatus Nanoarchaeia archaeon]